MEQKICIGKIVKTVGLKGEIKVLALTNSSKRFKFMDDFFIENEAFKTEHVAIKSDFVILKICGIDSVSQAEKLKDKLIFVDRKDAIKLKDDEFFVVDIVGLEMITLKGEFVGKIVDTENFGASDIIVFSRDGKEFRAPFLKDIFLDANFDENKIFVSDKIFEVMV